VDIKTSTTTNLTDAQRVDRLRLIRSDNVGPRGIMAQTPLRPWRDDDADQAVRHGLFDAATNAAGRNPRPEGFK
jgi:hypothetical protein